jgi:hypothetical protein
MAEAAHVQGVGPMSGEPAWVEQLRLDMAGSPEEVADKIAFPLLPVGQFVAVRTTSKTTIQGRFETFHEANPWVYPALCSLARDLKARGYKRIGIRTLWETLRWHHLRQTNDPSGATFKLNDHYMGRYARRIMDTEPDLDGMFEIRALRSP